jgi:hypothetical protein
MAAPLVKDQDTPGVYKRGGRYVPGRSRDGPQPARCFLLSLGVAYITLRRWTMGRDASGFAPGKHRSTEWRFG